MSEEHVPFYGKVIDRNSEQEQINNLLKKYNDEPVTEDLKEKVWNELMMEKHLGNITIPFNVSIQKDPDDVFPDLLRIELDTKV
jgi:hypothetical protein